jgi:hypothetical protein
MRCHHGIFMERRGKTTKYLNIKTAGLQELPEDMSRVYCYINHWDFVFLIWKKGCDQFQRVNMSLLIPLHTYRLLLNTCSELSFEKFRHPEHKLNVLHTMFLWRWTLFMLSLWTATLRLQQWWLASGPASEVPPLSLDRPSANFKHSIQQMHENCISVFLFLTTQRP